MKELIPFDYKGNEIRVIEQDGKVLFCGKDIATALEYRDTVSAIKRHCRGVAFHHPIVDSLGREQQARFITEGDVYRLIASSKLPAAQQFEAWIFDEVLPTIRRHGMYATPDTVEKLIANPDTMIQVLTALKEERAARQIAEAQVIEAQPKVLFADAVSSSKTSILIGQLAKILTQNGYKIGQNRLFAWLRDNGYLCRQAGTNWNVPTQRYIESGLFELKESTHQQPDGSVRISRTTKVTGKGQVYFINKFLTNNNTAASAVVDGEPSGEVVA